MNGTSNTREAAPRDLRALLAVPLAVLLLTAWLGGCVAKSTPPGANIAGGKVGQAGFTYLRWKQGLAIMIWHDLDSSSNHGSGSTEDPVYRLSGYALSLDGRRVDWQVETTDGKTAQFWIDDVRYDLAAGGLFIVTTRNGTTDVQQLHRDLSGIQPDYDSCVAFARGVPELARLIDGLSDPQAEAAIARSTELAREDLQTRFDLQREDILVLSIEPLAPLCRGLKGCVSGRPGYVIQFTAADQLYEYRTRILEEMIILWREVQNEPTVSFRHVTG